MSVPISYESIYRNVNVCTANVGSSVINIFSNIPDWILTATIFKFKMAAMSIAMGTRLHIDLNI